MAIKDYSTTASSNTSSSPNGYPVGTMKVSQLDDTGRQVMADIRAWYNTPQWRDLGHAVTYASTSSFTISGDVTASYIVGQRIQITDSSTLYGTISGSSYSAPNTTVTVTLDSGAISASIASVAVGIDPTNDPIPAAAIEGLTAAIEAAVSSVFTDGEIASAGDIKATARSTAPTGWLLCYGQTVSRTTYATLFSAIGTTYGAGDGSTTFALPDLRGRAIFGVDNMGSSAANRVTSGVSGITGTTLGASGGSQSMHQHTHTATVTDPGHTHGTRGTTGSGVQVATTESQGQTGTAQRPVMSATTGITVDNANAGSGSSENMPPAIMLNYIIKT